MVREDADLSAIQLQSVKTPAPNGSVTTKAVTPRTSVALYNPWPNNPNPPWVLPRGASIAWPGDVLAAGRPQGQSLFLTRGAPAKTTFARALVAALPLGTAVRVNKRRPSRDDAQRRVRPGHHREAGASSDITARA